MRKFFKRVSGLFIVNVKPKNTLGKFKIRSILNSVRKLQSSVQNCCVCVHSQNKLSVVSIIILQKSQRAESAIPHFCKNLLAGTMRIMNLYWKFLSLISFVATNVLV